MTTLIASIALVAGLASLGVLAFRLKRARNATASARTRFDAARARLAVLEADYKDGKLTEVQYHEQRHGVDPELIAATDKPAVKKERALWWLLGGIAVAGLVLGGGSLWRQWVQPSKVEAVPRSAPPAAASAAHPLTSNQLERSVAKMRDQVKANPKDAAAWAMLAHSYDMLGRYAEASTAYTSLIELVPKDAQVLADYADSLAMARGRKLDGEPLSLIQRALALDPKNLKALSLAGTEAFDRKDYSGAIGYWQRARTLVADETLKQEIDNGIADARQMQTGGAASGVAASSVKPAAPVSVGFVTGRVSLSAKLKSQVSADDALFVFARPADGSRMPVALMRRRAGELPLEFRLDDSTAMVPQARLSGQLQVIVGARISKRGDASPKAGDMQGFSAPIAVGTKGVNIEIAEVVK